ncbi:MAG: YbhB/YbcL family Raf kinase inhibitor-like protein [Anaerolineae bacterium]
MQAKSRWSARFVFACCVVPVLAGCASDSGGSRTDTGESLTGSVTGPGGAAPTAQLEVVSDAFAYGEAIPAGYTCDGEDTSPPLAWPTGPDGTAEYALIMDDPDAPSGTWVHWVAWGIDETSLPEGAGQVASALSDADAGPTAGKAAGPNSDSDAGHFTQGANSWDLGGYGGPCPPPGNVHRYSFRVYALDGPPDVGSGATAADLADAMDDHVLAVGELVGTYGR